MGNTEDKNKLNRGLLTTYNQSMDIRESMKLSLDEPNIRNINYDIDAERFKVPVQVCLWVEPFLKKETCEQADKRMMNAGLALANPFDLVGYLTNHPHKWEEWEWILAINKESGWEYSGNIYVVCAYNYGTTRGYTHWSVRDPVSSNDSDRHGILVVDRS